MAFGTDESVLFRGVLNSGCPYREVHCIHHEIKYNVYYTYMHVYVYIMNMYSKYICIYLPSLSVSDPGSIF